MEENGIDIVVYSLTDIGRTRGNNKDSFLYIELEGKVKSATYFMAVADGGTRRERSGKPPYDRSFGKIRRLKPYNKRSRALKKRHNGSQSLYT